MNACAEPVGFEPETAGQTLNRWMLTEAARVSRDVTRALEEYRFSEAAATLYAFVWNTYCDWYLELIKPILSGDDAAAKDETRAAAGAGLKVILALLHPFMPFVTEKLWGRHSSENKRPEGLLVVSGWPRLDFEDAAAAAEVNWLVELVSAIRSVRSEMNVPAAAKTRLVVLGDPGELRQRLAKHGPAIEFLARVDGVDFAQNAPKGSAQIVVGGTTLALPLAGLIDFAAERARLERELQRVEGEIDRIDRKLANEKFVAKAPEEVVDAEREKREVYAADRARLAAALQRIAEAE
jgi:valyl-tRNA synthetase